MAILRLFDPTTQFQTKSGALNVAGKLRIYVESTDDLANIYGDDGSLLPQPLLLDSNGRARGLFVDSGRSYRLEVYDRNDSLLFTIRRLEPNASGTIVNPTIFIKGTPDEIDVADSVTDESRTYTVSLSAKVKGSIASNQEAIVKESEARKGADDELRTLIDGISKVEAGTASPLMDGKASVGNSLKYAREDHVHPSDTSREDIANKTTVVLGTSDSKYPTDKAVAEFVNSSIATNTANYISNNGEPFTSVEQLEAYSGPVTNNDYAFVTGTDSDGNTYYDRYKATVSGSTVTWALEYRLNNSSFTAAQWSAINSGITSALVAKVHEHGNKAVLDGITADKVSAWNGKQDKLTFDSTPTANSTNPVTSGGIKKALDLKANGSDLTAHTGDTTVHITAAERTAWNAKASTSVATTSADGLMSAADKTKLNGIATGAEANVQADWNETNKSSDAFIKNKPYFTKYIGSSGINFKVCTFVKYASSGEDSDGIEVFYRCGYGAVHGHLLHRVTFELYLERIGNVSSNTNTVRFYYVENSSTVDIYAASGSYCRLTAAPLANMPKNRIDFTNFGTSVDSIPEGAVAINPVWVANSSASSGTAPVKVDAYGNLTAVPMDSTPTASSTNLMTSGAIKTALEVLQSNIDTVDAKGIVINEINGENVICFE